MCWKHCEVSVFLELLMGNIYKKYITQVYGKTLE
jgi:hypothetical protein